MKAAIIWSRLTKSIFEPVILAGSAHALSHCGASVGARACTGAADDCVCYARALMVDARVFDDEHDRVGAARKVEYRACDFGGVGTIVIVEQAHRRMQAQARGIPSVSMTFCGATTATTAPVAAEKGDF